MPNPFPLYGIFPDGGNYSVQTVGRDYFTKWDGGQPATLPSSPYPDSGS